MTGPGNDRAARYRRAVFRPGNSPSHTASAPPQLGWNASDLNKGVERPPHHLNYPPSFRMINNGPDVSDENARPHHREAKRPDLPVSSPRALLRPV